MMVMMMIMMMMMMMMMTTTTTTTMMITVVIQVCNHRLLGPDGRPKPGLQKGKDYRGLNREVLLLHAHAYMSSHVHC
jgi:hypothetical protein